MTEVGGTAAIYIPVMPHNNEDLVLWAINAAEKMNDVVSLNQEERNVLINKGFTNAKRFNTIDAIDKIDEVIQSLS